MYGGIALTGASLSFGSRERVNDVQSMVEESVSN